MMMPRVGNRRRRGSSHVTVPVGSRIRHPQGATADSPNRIRSVDSLCMPASNVYVQHNSKLRPIASSFLRNCGMRPRRSYRSRSGIFVRLHAVHAFHNILHASLTIIGPSVACCESGLFNSVSGVFQLLQSASAVRTSADELQSGGADLTCGLWI